MHINLIFTHMIIILLAAIGIPGNLLLMYIVATASEKLTIPDIFILHISAANIAQLTARIPAVLVSHQGEICYPMALPCKISLFILFCSRKACIWFILKLDVYHFMKLTNRTGFLKFVFLNYRWVIFCVAMNWVMWIALGLPYVLLVPSDRPRQQDDIVNSTCHCSFFDSLTETDSFLKTYDMIFGTVIQFLAIVLICLVDIKVLWILVKHQQTIFTETTAQRLRNHQREVGAIKVITSLVVFFVLCHLLDAFLRNYPGHVVSELKRGFDHLYPAMTPFILGYADQRFIQKLTCILCYRDCKKNKVSQIVTVS